jgi:hypothetical protein
MGSIPWCLSCRVDSEDPYFIMLVSSKSTFWSTRCERCGRTSWFWLFAISAETHQCKCSKLILHILREFCQMCPQLYIWRAIYQPFFIISLSFILHYLILLLEAEEPVQLSGIYFIILAENVLPPALLSKVLDW